MDLKAAQAYMTQSGIDGWLLWDFRGSNPVFWQVMGAKKHTTRRNMLLVPREGEPTLLTQVLDADLFADCGFKPVRYATWADLQTQIKSLLGGLSRLAMEYSPGGALPIVSYVDAGTVDLVRSLGIEVVSSAGVFQEAAARWDEAAYQSHLSACRLVDQAKDAAFAFIGQQLSAGRKLSEYDVQQFILEQFKAHGLETDDPPIVGVNPNSGNPHYQPSATRSSPIQKGDWVLIDLWAKHPGPRNVFADITWVGSVGVPSAEHQRVFNIVKEARDAAVRRLKQAWQAGEQLMGWQVDRVTREVIEKAGHGSHFFHRTGHSMGPGDTVHALGVNLDSLETHDTRRIVPGVGFSVEPGIYLPAFGVRSEINVFVHPKDGPQVTTRQQEEIIRLAVGA